jgi:hypothetical protein
MLFQKLIGVVLLIIFVEVELAGGEEFAFDIDEFEKKSLEWGGYLEFKGAHMDLNRNGSYSLLDSPHDRRSTLDRFTGTVQFDGNFNNGIVDFNWLIQAFGRYDQEQWVDDADIFEAYSSIKPTPHATIELGKKVFKWGKGYAWNPVGFIDRPKDANNPEEALEGLIGAGLDLIKSFSGSLQTAALTMVALPVWQGVNEDFGELHDINLASKLYLLYYDVDIDLIVLSGDRRNDRYGLDFSMNLATNFEIHGEVAHTPKQAQKILTDTGAIEIREDTDTSYLTGLRYLSQSDITTIIEYYHNDDGYSVQEQKLFYELVDNAHDLLALNGDTSLFSTASLLSQGAYGRPQSGRNYLYVRVTQKEPFDLLYITPGSSAILNLDDESFSVTPEVIYTGLTDWELRLRFSLLEGSYDSEFGEKQNDNKLELRVRCFF